MDLQQNWGVDAEPLWTVNGSARSDRLEPARVGAG